MTLTLLLWIPLTLITVVIRLGLAVTKLTSRLALATAKEIQANVNENTKVNTGSDAIQDKIKDTVSTGKKAVKGTARVMTGTAKTAVKTTKIAMKVANTTVKIGTRTLKIGVKTLKLTIQLLKLFIQFISWLAGVIASFGTVAIIVVVFMVVIVVAGGVFTTFWDDKITVTVDSSQSVTNTANSTSSKDSSATTVSSDLSVLDTKKINYEVKRSKCKYKKNVKTNLVRKDVTKLANLLMNKDNTVSRGNSTVCKYFYYSQACAFGRNSACGSAEFSKINTAGQISSSKSVKSMAGIMLTDKRMYDVDCSSFIGWFYATLFTAYDKDNEDIDELANWFAGFVSTDYKASKYCTKISKKDVKPGDIKFTPAGGKHGSNHVVLCISKDKCLGASSSRTGVKLGNLSYYDDAGDYYRPNFKFADD